MVKKTLVLVGTAFFTISAGFGAEMSADSAIASRGMSLRNAFYPGTLEQ